MDTSIKKTKDWVNLVLRRIDSNGAETDTILGGYCSFIFKKDSLVIFKEITKLWSEDDLKNVYGVVTFFSDSIMPLYTDSFYYEMTDTGGTVANRSKK